MIELETIPLSEVPIGGVFIAENKEFFAPPYDKGVEVYFKTKESHFKNVGDKSFGDYYGIGWEEVVYTGVILNG